MPTRFASVGAPRSRIVVIQSYLRQNESIDLANSFRQRGNSLHDRKSATEAMRNITFSQLLPLASSKKSTMKLSPLLMLLPFAVLACADREDASEHRIRGLKLKVSIDTLYIVCPCRVPGKIIHLDRSTSGIVFHAITVPPDFAGQWIS
jgi:hypothetical protein